MNTLISAPTRTAAEAKLVLHVVCHEWLVAVDTERIERVALEDTFAPRGENLAGAPRGYLGILRAESREYASWDLATLVGREPQRGAWVLFGGHDSRTDLPIALRTGACRTVGRLQESALSSLPRGLCGLERRPFRGADIIKVERAKEK